MRYVRVRVESRHGHRHDELAIIVVLAARAEADVVVCTYKKFPRITHRSDGVCGRGG